MVTNAGMQVIDAIVDFPPEKFRMLLALMVEAPFLLSESAIRCLVEPEEVADLVGLLASPGAAMVTGASYTMDGGWSAR